MSINQCEAYGCHSEFPNRIDLEIHKLKEHMTFKDDKDIPEEFLKRFTKQVDRVTLLCELKPVCKGNYVLLYQYYIYLFLGLRWYVDWDRLQQIPSPETITRAYRKAKEQGKIKETPKTEAKREVMEEVIRNNINKI